jgi:hypothetical protein
MMNGTSTSSFWGMLQQEFDYLKRVKFRIDWGIGIRFV